MASNLDKSKDLSSDVYGINLYVNQVKKNFIPNVAEDTLLLGTFGYLGQIFSDTIQNSIVMASEFANESIPTKAKFEKNIISHALGLGIVDINATPSTMDVLLTISEEDIEKLYPVALAKGEEFEWSFTFDKNIPIYIGDFEFHTDYDIIFKKVQVGAGKFAYTAKYDIDIDNPVSDVTNPYLPSPVRMNSNGGHILYTKCTLRQVESNTISKKILSDNSIASKTLTFDFEGQLAAFTIDVNEGGEVTHLVPAYEGLEVENKKYQYFYYNYLDANTIRVKFDRYSYMPRINSDVTINVQTTQGESGNFEYDMTKHTTFTAQSTKHGYTNVFCEVRPVTGESLNGTNKKTIDDLKNLIPKEALSRGSITNLADLKNFFNMLNTDNSILYFYKKRDNTLERLYYSYIIMKDAYDNIIPTNTIDVRIPISSDFATTKKQIIMKNQGFLLGDDGVAVPDVLCFHKNENGEYDCTKNDDGTLTCNKCGKTFNAMDGRDKFYYMIPYNFAINGSPLYGFYFLTTFDMKKFLDFSYIKEQSTYQYIATSANWYRGITKNTEDPDENTYNKYELSVSFERNITNEQSSDNVMEESLRCFAVFYNSDDKPVRYAEGNLTDTSNIANGIYNFKFFFETEDQLDNNNRMKITGGLNDVLETEEEPSGDGGLDIDDDTIVIPEGSYRTGVYDYEITYWHKKHADEFILLGGLFSGDLSSGLGGIKAKACTTNVIATIDESLSISDFNQMKRNYMAIEGLGALKALRELSFNKLSNDEFKSSVLDYYDIEPGDRVIALNITDEYLDYCKKYPNSMVEGFIDGDNTSEIMTAEFYNACISIAFQHLEVIVYEVDENTNFNRVEFEDGDIVYSTVIPSNDMTNGIAPVNMMRNIINALYKYDSESKSFKFIDFDNTSVDDFDENRYFILYNKNDEIVSILQETKYIDPNIDGYNTIYYTSLTPGTSLKTVDGSIFGVDGEDISMDLICIDREDTKTKVCINNKIYNTTYTAIKQYASVFRYIVLISFIGGDTSEDLLNIVMEYLDGDDEEPSDDMIDTLINLELEESGESLSQSEIEQAKAEFKEQLKTLKIEVQYIIIVMEAIMVMNHIEVYNTLKATALAARDELEELENYPEFLKNAYRSLFEIVETSLSSFEYIGDAGSGTGSGGGDTTDYSYFNSNMKCVLHVLTNLSDLNDTSYTNPNEDKPQDLKNIIPELDGYTLTNSYTIMEGLDFFYNYSDIITSTVTVENDISEEDMRMIKEKDNLIELMWYLLDQVYHDDGGIDNVTQFKTRSSADGKNIYKYMYRLPIGFFVENEFITGPASSREAFSDRYHSEAFYTIYFNDYLKNTNIQLEIWSNISDESYGYIMIGGRTNIQPIQLLNNTERQTSIYTINMNNSDNVICIKLSDFINSEFRILTMAPDFIMNKTVFKNTFYNNKFGYDDNAFLGLFDTDTFYNDGILNSDYVLKTLYDNLKYTYDVIINGKEIDFENDTSLYNFLYHKFYIPTAEHGYEASSSYLLDHEMISDMKDVLTSIGTMSFDYFKKVMKHMTRYSNTLTPQPTNFLVKNVPVVKYDYFNEDYKAIEFCKELIKRKNYIDYAITVLEDAFGMDFKFFNTYGPSKLFTTDDGESYLNRTNISLTFKLKLKPNYDTNITNDIVQDIKLYVEDINTISTVHIPNLISMVINKYSESIEYFEFVDINGYGPSIQHIYSMQMPDKIVVPEFINISTLENGTADINLILE